MENVTGAPDAYIIHKTQSAVQLTQTSADCRLK